jgi:hypothetical protein
VLIREGIEVVAGIGLVGLALRDVFDTVVVPGEIQGGLACGAAASLRDAATMEADASRQDGGLDQLRSIGADGVVRNVDGAAADRLRPRHSWARKLVLPSGRKLRAGGLHCGQFARHRRPVRHRGVRTCALGSGQCGYLWPGGAHDGGDLPDRGQEGISRRDRGVLKITTASGQPPSALQMLERYADLDAPEEMRRALYDGRDWCVAVLQSHASHPSLIYFRSVGTGSGWPAALGTIMDLALVFELLIDDPKSRAAAVLLRDEGLRLVGEIAGLIGLEPKDVRPTASEVVAVCKRLATAGYRLKPDPDLEAFAARRAEHARAIETIASHLGTPAAPLLP